MLSDKEDYLKVYELIMKEEQHFLEAHQTRVKFYMSIISVLMAATVAGVMKATIWYHFIILTAGPILSLLASSIASDGTFRLYQRFLESVTMRAKLEQVLGFTKIPQFDSSIENLYWQNEGIVAPRHIESRKEFDSSKSFLEKFSRKGYHHSTKMLFRGFQVLSVLFLFSLIGLSVSVA